MTKQEFGVTTSFDPDFPPGTRLIGKWNKHRYRLERVLGEGANGRVYLALRNGKRCAIKMGFDPADHQSEVNVLRQVYRSIGSDRFLLDADDFSSGGVDYPFYAMRFVEGIHPREFLRKHSPDWLFVIGSSILRKLSALHARQWIFGDLKLDNLLVTDNGQAELIDYGGVTAKGKSVKQFTEIHDRGFWDGGSRTADEGYDLFAFAVLCLQLEDPAFGPEGGRAVIPQNRNPSYLKERVRAVISDDARANMLCRLIDGKVATTEEALELWDRSGPRYREAWLHDPHIPWVPAFFTAALLLFSGSVFYVLLR